MKQWTEIRDKKVEEIAQKQGISEIKVTTFKPEINDKSSIMMKKKTNRIPVYEQEPNPKKPKVDKNCTFKPNLNKTIKKWSFYPLTTYFIYLTKTVNNI